MEFKVSTADRIKKKQLRNIVPPQLSLKSTGASLRVKPSAFAMTGDEPQVLLIHDERKCRRFLQQNSI
jgi:hypothetical protein